MQFESLLDSFIVMLALIGAAIWFRQKNVIQAHEQGVFARLVTDFALPALIFANLSSEPFNLDNLYLAFVIFISIALVMVVAWAIGRWMQLERPVLGSVILVSGVGSTSTLGYSLVHGIFGENTEVMSQLVVMGEVGVVMPLFTFGVAIASYFGTDVEDGPDVIDAAKSFLRSPIFIAFVLGILVSSFGLAPDHKAMDLLSSVLRIASDSLTFLVAFTIGLMLKPVSFREIAGLLVLVCGLKLLLEPAIAAAFATVLGLTEFQKDILIIEAAMPSGALAAVIAARYGCDAATASALLIATYAFGLFAIPIVGLIAL